MINIKIDCDFCNAEFEEKSKAYPRNLLQVYGTLKNSAELKNWVYTEMSQKIATSLVWQMNGSKIRIVQSFQRLLTNYIETKKGSIGNTSLLLNKHN